jgi:cysteine synthase A
VRGVYTENDTVRDLQLLGSVGLDNMKELNYYDKKAIHNLKYYTWIEQQAKDVEELNAQWYDHDNYWTNTFNQVDEIDELITEFNNKVGLL